MAVQAPGPLPKGMIHCHTCNAAIAKSARTCPQCGARRKLSKSTTLIAAGVVIAAIVGGVAGNATKKPNTVTIVHPEATPRTAMPFASYELEGKLQAKVGDGSLFQKGNLQVDRWSDDGITLTYTFNDGQRISMTAAEVSATGITKFTIDELMAGGFNPHEHSMAINTHVHQTTRGATGVALVRNFGTSRYRPENDQIAWDPQ